MTEPAPQKEPLLEETSPVSEGKEPILQTSQEETSVATEVSQTTPEETVSVVEHPSNAIVFEEGTDELTENQKGQIESIVKRFKNAPTDKIAIYTYNVNEGTDTFKKKRLSLNRAVEIRSHLIKSGYKNFSIKVINIKADSKKANTVELEEI